MKSVSQIFIFSILKTITAIVFIILFIIPLSLVGQLQERFSDGNLNQNPPWEGDTSDFTVADQTLVLSAEPQTGNSYLVTKSNVAYGTWTFKVSMLFNPSGSNYVRVYLMADQPDLNLPLNGYFILLGGSQDEISLFRQNGTSRIKIIDGLDGRLNSPTISVMITVTRSILGLWEVGSKLNDEDTMQSEGSVIDNQFREGSWFGIQCVYTATRNDKFAFDDITVEQDSDSDLIPPVLLSAETLNPTTLKVHFSEPIHPMTGTDPSNFVVNNDVGVPIMASISSEDPAAVTLNFSIPFVDETEYVLTVNTVDDLFGNRNNNQKIDFKSRLPVKLAWKDVIITEIFADPEPSIGLPAIEFVELLNRSGRAVSLDAWTLSDAAGRATIKTLVLEPNEYAIVTSSAGSAYRAFGNTVIVASFPSLNNTGDAVVLKDENNVTIDSLYYDDSWYRESAKRNGGWTLELIDPENLCAEKENWSASEDSVGGTPGRENSVRAEKPDLTGPGLISAFAAGEKTLLLTFDEKLEQRTPATDAFEFSGGLTAGSVVLLPDLRTISIETIQPLVLGLAYEIKVRNVYDCAGNIIRDELSRANVALPEVADSLDVVINEILFNPRPGGSDFVEICNRSGKYLNLRGWNIGRLREGVCSELKLISSTNMVVSPGFYLALTADSENIANEYPHAQNLVQISMPPYNDDEGAPCLTDEAGKLIDAMWYTKDMHSPFIRNPEGVSLERIDLNNASTHSQNWKSAAESVGFATPGLQNSNSLGVPDLSNNISVVPEVFIPITGQPEYALIQYSFETGNYIANIHIFDSRGRRIKVIAENVLLGSSGFFRWDGDGDDGRKARVGNYMVKFELFDHTGILNTFLKRVVVAGRF